MSHIHINFEHVNYSYEKSVPILQDITFTAHENDSIGLIGANGVGKSTLLRLLVGLNLDYEGSIRVEEMPVVKEMLPKVREKIGYVFQDSDSQLFMSTVFEDVAFAPRNYGLPEEGGGKTCKPCTETDSHRASAGQTNLQNVGRRKKDGIDRDDSRYDTGYYPDGRAIDCTRSQKPQITDPHSERF